MKIYSTALLFIFTLAASAAENTPPVLKCSDHVIVQKAMIAALQSKLETQTMRITALSNLLGANQRESVDEAAQARIAEAERKILSNMGLTPNCKIQRDGSIKCPLEPSQPSADVSDPQDSETVYPKPPETTSANIGETTSP